MARNVQLLQSRDEELRADYKSLLGKAYPIRWEGRTLDVKLRPEQIHQLLGKKYHLSTRRIEDILYPFATANKAPHDTPAPHPTAAAAH